ncbi:MAG TPA: hypothetical protein VK734_21740, partial [Bradyrhizobium sp.]|nr:hypothetical protein [Bradyrhizobium sp.]
MRIQMFAASVTGIVLSLVAFAPAQVWAQADAKPIGKVVATTGSVSIEHAGAIIVQANAPAQAGETKIGDLVYQGDLVKTGADGKVGINFTDGTSFNLSSSAQMTLD